MITLNTAAPDPNFRCTFPECGHFPRQCLGSTAREDAERAVVEAAVAWRTKHGIATTGGLIVAIDTYLALNPAPETKV